MATWGCESLPAGRLWPKEGSAPRKPADVVKRSQEYLAKIDTGGPGALVQLVRDLQSTADGSRFSQRNLFELALERLAAEFAAVDRIAKLDAIDMLNHELAQAPAESAAGLHRPNVSL